MKIKLPFYLQLSLLICIAGCQNRVENKALDSAKLIKQVKSQIHAFHAADTSLNAEGMVELLWPEYTMLADGNHLDYEAVKIGSKAYMASLETFHSEWKDLKIIPIGSNHAISSFIFIDSIVAKDGTITQVKGPNTFVWEKRNKEWKILYGDADHYPIK